MSGRYKVPYLVGNTLIRDHQMWPAIEDPLFSAIIGEATGFDRVTVNWYGAANLTLAQLIAITWRIFAWEFSGGWGFLDDLFIEPGHIPNGTIQVDNTFENASNPSNHVVFSTCDNDLVTFHMPLSLEPLLVSQSFGPNHSPRDYIHDFNPGTSILGGALDLLHSFGMRVNNVNNAAEQQSIVQGVTYHSVPFAIKFLRDFYFSGSFNSGRGMDMVRYKPLGGGPSGPPTFDALCSLDSQHGGSTPYGFISTRIGDFGISGPTNATIVIDPVITPTFNIPAYIGSSAGGAGSGQERNAQHCTIKLTAVGFFEYGDSTGAPIWDAVTGAQLRDPFG